MKVTFSKDCEETFWAINDEYPYHIDPVEGIALVQCVIDYLADKAVLPQPTITMIAPTLTAADLPEGFINE